jgi:hypothetical protein
MNNLNADEKVVDAGRQGDKGTPLFIRTDIAHLLIGGRPSHAHDGRFTGQGKKNIYTYLYSRRGEQRLLIEVVIAEWG